jgi:hypothetical protein
MMMSPSSQTIDSHGDVASNSTSVQQETRHAQANVRNPRALFTLPMVASAVATRVMLYSGEIVTNSFETASMCGELMRTCSSA